MNVRDSKSVLRFHFSIRCLLHHCAHTVTLSDHKSSIPRSRFMSFARGKRWLYLALKMALTPGNNVSIKRCKYSPNEICDRHTCQNRLHLTKASCGLQHDTQHYRTNTRLHFILLTGWIHSLMWSSPQTISTICPKVLETLLI